MTRILLLLMVIILKLNLIHFVLYVPLWLIYRTQLCFFFYSIFLFFRPQPFSLFSLFHSLHWLPVQLNVGIHHIIQDQLNSPTNMLYLRARWDVRCSLYLISRSCLGKKKIKKSMKWMTNADKRYQISVFWLHFHEVIAYSGTFLCSWKIRYQMLPVWHSEFEISYRGNLKGNNTLGG